jgi:hypothetical protein
MPVNFVLCIHNHQPVDNFDPVFSQAFEDSYLPFIDRIEKRGGIKFVAHYSGPLLEWLDKNRPEFLDRLKGLVEAGRLEIMGGGFYEPIFTMLPDEDAAGQLAMMSDFLSRRFGRKPEGAWLPERVWEAALAPLFARAGIKYTVLDDLHFRAAGVAPADLDGAYLTEDRGEILRVFPIHEELRYSIPFKDPAWTIDYLQRYADDSGRRTVVYADDGEKFGLWPNSKRHVFDDGWLDRFLDALEAASGRVRTRTFSEVLAEPAPVRRVYLPSTSYREMGEWALPPAAQAEYESLSEELKRLNRFEAAKPLLQGGTWRSFKAKYPEANLMYGRMLHVSRKARKAGRPDALQELYRAQCNCGYWHGVFGGLHIPHLRGSVYRHLIAAERIIEKNGPASGAEKLDLDIDGQEDVRLFNPKLNVFITPATGGHIAELDVRDAGVNLTASLARRKEHYHTKLRQATTANPEAKSIHDLVVSKVENIDRHLVYDSHPRATLVDHFFAPDASIDDASKGWKEIGDFTTGAYEAETPLGMTCALRRRGRVGSTPVKVRKDVALAGHEVVATYTLEAESPLEAIFGVEFNIASLSPTAPDGVVTGPGTHMTGSLGDRIEGRGVRMSISDRWHGLEVELVVPRGADFWSFPIHSVSQSESGFDLSYQSTVILPHWKLKLEPGKTWSVTLTLGARKR